MVISHGQLNLIIWLRCSATLYWALTLDQKLKDNEKIFADLDRNYICCSFQKSLRASAEEKMSMMRLEPVTYWACDYQKYSPYQLSYTAITAIPYWLPNIGF
jgi:hypothetical protein